MSSKSPSDVVIVSALRTPLFRSRKGALAKVPPSTLLTTVFKATLKQANVEGKDVEDICLGNCLMPPSGFAAMRMAQLVAGIPETTSLQWVVRRYYILYRFKCMSCFVAHTQHSLLPKESSM